MNRLPKWMALISLLMTSFAFGQSLASLATTTPRKPSEQSSYAPVSIITITADLNGALTWEPIVMKGMVSGGHCVMTARNKATTERLTDIWLGGYSSDAITVRNSITINHPAVSGLKVDIVCFATRGDK
jgi:hypothetical protein